MAFTVAHMAAALPFHKSRRWLCFEALLIGTMLPDLPYYLPYMLGGGRQASQLAHQWPGLFSYCLPWGLLMLVLWFGLIRSAIIALIQPWHSELQSDAESPTTRRFPTGYASNIGTFSTLKPHLAFWLKVALALLLGGATHLVWDGITHKDGFIAEQVGWLQSSINIWFVGKMNVARLLQYLSSLAGLGLLARFAYLKYKSQLAGDYIDTQKKSILELPAGSLKLTKSHSFLIIGIICFITFLCGVLAVIRWDHLLAYNKYLFAARILVGSLQCLGGLILGYAMIYQLMNRVR